ncbi:MAG TPA: response regulator [Terriglobales bacterium]|nr:response regulator [Terriglobales bacterium]
MTSSETRPWRAVVVDDEPLARQTLRLLLAREQDFSIVAECGDGAEAIATIGRERPDVLFLDVQMPELDGFEVLRQIGPGSIPAIIFVTAFDQYALRAFEEHALEYLLKPFSDERFAVVVEWTRTRLRERKNASMAGRLSDLLSTVAPQRRQLAVRDSGRTVVIPHDEILWIEAEDYCARIHLRGRTLLVRDSLRSLESALSESGFVRVHRSAIASVACMREIEPARSGDQRLTLCDGTVLKVSRKYRAAVISGLTKHASVSQLPARK